MIIKATKSSEIQTQRHKIPESIKLAVLATCLQSNSLGSFNIRHLLTHVLQFVGEEYTIVIIMNQSPKVVTSI